LSTYSGPEAGNEVMVKAIDYTTKGDNDNIEVMVGGSTKKEIQKKYLTNVLVEGRELNEYGVYNSENDVNNNVKTKENEPSDEQGFIVKLADSVKHVIGSLTEIKGTVRDESKLSFDPLDVAIAELTSYVQSLEEEGEVIASATPN
jgi:hypothetical protein